MRIRRAGVTLALLLTSTAFAQTYRFAKPAPLTNTRYQTVDARATLASNGSDFFLFWTSQGRVRVSPVVEGEAMMGRVILHGSQTPAVVWTGTHFVVASEWGTRIVDANGNPVGNPSPIANATYAQLATNGRNVVLIAFTNNVGSRAYVLNSAGAPADAGTDIESGYNQFAIASNGDGYLVASVPLSSQWRLTMLDEKGGKRSQQFVSAAAIETVYSPAIASNGRDYLLVWTDGLSQSVKARVVDRNGQPQPAFSISPADLGVITPPSVVWAGDHYAVAYAHSRVTDVGFDLAEVVHVDLRTGDSYGKTSLEGFSYHAPSLAYAGGKLLASWGTGTATTVRDLTIESGPPASVAWSASPQSLVDAVSSSSSTLVLWTEGYGQQMHLGIRGHDGSWSERRTDHRYRNSLATNGDGFVIVSADYLGGDATATRLAANGTPLGATSIPFNAQDVVWKGSAYVIGGKRGAEVVAATLGSDGTLSPVTVIRPSDGADRSEVRLASDGTNVLALWLRVSCTVHCWGGATGFTIGATLLGPDLKELTTGGFGIAPSQVVTSADAEWDGQQYVVVFPSTGVVKAIRVSRAGTPESSLITISSQTQGAIVPIELNALPGGVGISWTKPVPSVYPVPPMILAFLLGRDAKVSPLDTSGFVSAADYGQTLFALPENRIGYIGAHFMNDSDPHFGTIRLAFAIADVTAAPAVPGPPRASVDLEGQNTLRITWTAPPQTVNGYRVEYSIGDDAWLEFDRWFGASERTLAVTLAQRRTTPYRFRVRAWNDGGVGAYSDVASITFGKKRRSAR